ncbi:MAG: hypothetical protein MUO52_05165, partial [Desulfobacterales bacterium]|nr:hypothetical protein [Desulfobacterales bacterium]
LFVVFHHFRFIKSLHVSVVAQARHPWALSTAFPIDALCRSPKASLSFSASDLIKSGIFKKLRDVCLGFSGS